MPKIDICPEDRDSERQLLHYMRSNTTRPKTARLAAHLTGRLMPQRGESCKLKALYEAVSHSALVDGVTPIPLYKSGTHGASIRQAAKKVGSRVGEIYSLHQLTALAKHLAFPSVTYKAFNEDDYLAHLTALIDIGQPAVVFYEVDRDMRSGHYAHPAISKGEENEHAILVVGYYRTAFDEVKLIVKNWDEYYEVDGMEMALSSLNLPDTRTHETFGKVYYGRTSEWTLLSRVEKERPELCEHIKVRKAFPISKSHVALRGHLFCIPSSRTADHVETLLSNSNTKGMVDEKEEEEERSAAPIL